MSVRKSVLDKFVRLGGYEIVKNVKGKWKNISEASRKTGISRPTIYLILKTYPERPDKTLPKYVKEWEDSQALVVLTEKFQRRDFFKTLVSTIREGFVFLGNKDPVTWTEKDYQTIWNSEKFLDQQTGWIKYGKSVDFRRCMRATGRTDLLEKFETKSRTAGAKKLWYLEDSEIVALAPELPTCDMVVQTLRGITEGARHQALCTTTPNKIQEAEKVLMVYESKVDTWVEKIHTDPVMNLICRYIKDFNIKGDQKLHELSYTSYLDKLKDAGVRAGIKKKVTTHIFKHTFVSQAHKHGVSGEVVGEQCNTELRTLQKFYRASDEKKKRHELRGEEYDVMPFNEWVEKIIYPAFEQRYNELRKVRG